MNARAAALSRILILSLAMLFASRPASAQYGEAYVLGGALNGVWRFHGTPEIRSLPPLNQERYSSRAAADW